jgi:hypothetical protein
MIYRLLILFLVIYLTPSELRANQPTSCESVRRRATSWLEANSARKLGIELSINAALTRMPQREDYGYGYYGSAEAELISQDRLEARFVGHQSNYYVAGSNQPFAENRVRQIDWQWQADEMLLRADPYGDQLKVKNLRCLQSRFGDFVSGHVLYHRQPLLINLAISRGSR